MNINRGIIKRPQKVVLYGPEGIGKSTFASQFPNPLFIDTEGSTDHMDVARLDTPTSWTMLLSEVSYVIKNPSICETLVIDTADWAETLCKNHIIQQNKGWNSIETPGYGKGYTVLAEEWGKLLNLLTDVISAGVNVCLTGHAQIRKFEQPDEMGAYDRWELKLEKKTAGLTKEWADILLFANYKTDIITGDNKKKKAVGGKRIMYTTHHPAWDAKNRFGLPEELELNFQSIAHIFAPIDAQQHAQQVTETPATVPVSKPIPAQIPTQQDSAYEGIIKPLADLMFQYDILPEQLSKAIGPVGNGGLGYFPEGTEIKSLATDFQEYIVTQWATEFLPKANPVGLPFEM